MIAHALAALLMLACAGLGLVCGRAWYRESGHMPTAVISGAAVAAAASELIVWVLGLIAGAL